MYKKVAIKIAPKPNASDRMIILTINAVPLDGVGNGVLDVILFRYFSIAIISVLVLLLAQLAQHTSCLDWWYSIESFALFDLGIK
jgi:hypothetical protein